jgi:hypothetical protein
LFRAELSNRKPLAVFLIEGRGIGLFPTFADGLMDNSFWSDVRNLVWQLDRKGKILPPTDVSIPVCA